MTFDAARLASVVSPLRRALLAAARKKERLPELSDAQVEVIRALPEGLVASPSELAERLGVGRSTVSNLLVAMERDGLITRRTRTEDRRQVDVAASGKALRYFERYDAASTAILRDAASTLSASDLASLSLAIPALEHLRDALIAHPEIASNPEGTKDHDPLSA